MFYSPLRYPGGKNKLAAFVAKICIDNKINGHYIEPFAGGASVAIFLLLEGYVKRITINDKDRSIYAFWHSVLHSTEKLCRLIDETEVNISNWRHQKEIQQRKSQISLLQLGFSTLFLNRCNRSGIITGGAIGGIAQTGNYKIDCRFNKDEIKARIRAIAKYKEFISLYNLDAIDLIDLVAQNQEDNPDQSIFYFDPPYYLKAESLYMNYYKDGHHKEVADKIMQINNAHWIVSYDDHEFINQLYTERDNKKYSFNHSAASPRQGKEILYFSSGIKQPSLDHYNPVNFKVRRKNNTKTIVYKK